MRRIICGLCLATLIAGCGESEAERKQREQMEKRNEALRAEASSQKLLAQLVTNSVIAARKAIIDKDSPALRQAVADLKKLGAPAVERLQEEALKQERTERIAAITVLGEMGTDAKAATTTLESLSKEETAAQVKEAASLALAKIRGK